MDEVEDFGFNASFDNGSSAEGAFDVDFTTGTVSGYFSPGSSFGQISSISYDNGVYTISGQGRLGLRSTGSITLSFTGQNPTNFDSGKLDINTFPGQDASGKLTSSSISVLCFATGTRIRTSSGDVAVEQLRVGDLAATASGETRPIVWVGHRETDCGPNAAARRPVRIGAHAFGAGLPARDLLLSPGHPVLVGADEDGAGGHLVPIMCLINGTTIERVAVDAVTYWHVELDGHDILLAEGLPAESYIDLGSRPWFEKADGLLDDPDMTAPGMPGRCRPVAIDGPIVEAERRRLDAVLAMRLATACAWPAGQATAWLG